ncbi:MAG: DUF3253 domain-containing protein [Shimia sp.]
MASDDDIRAALGALAAARRGRTFCPSEAARRVADDWRPLMPRVREIAVEMGLRATQRGVPVVATEARGPVRLAGRSDEATEERSSRRSSLGDRP